MSLALDLNRQALGLLGALLLGLGLGLAYDLLRPPRQGTGPLLTALLDVLFCLTAASAAFLYAMGVGEGRLGLWALAAILLGFLLYMDLLSRFFLGPFSRLWRVLERVGGLVKKFISMIVLSAKKAFLKMREYFTANRKKPGEA